MAGFTYDKYKESDLVRQDREKLDANSVYKQSQSVTDAYDKLNALKSPDPYTSKYQEKIDSTMAGIENRKPFEYDLNGDMLYQQYKDQYINQGRMAMQDTMGQASAMTGGYGNSYASTAGNQAYQGYLQKLNDIVPQLYQIAYDKYQSEGQDMYSRLSMYQSAEDADYGRYRDSVSDFNTERSYLTDLYNTEREFDYGQFSDNRNFLQSQYDSDRTYDYGLYSDSYNRAFQSYQQQVSEDQFNQNLALEKAKLAETIRSNKASEAKKTESDKSDDTPKKDPNNYSDWDAGDWESYFAQIRNSEGVEAAKKELKYFTDNGYIPKNYVSYASIGARGKLGH